MSRTLRALATTPAGSTLCTEQPFPQSLLNTSIFTLQRYPPQKECAGLRSLKSTRKVKAEEFCRARCWRLRLACVLLFGIQNPSNSGEKGVNVVGLFNQGCTRLKDTMLRYKIMRITRHVE
jgi:hypothetical protein